MKKYRINKVPIRKMQNGGSTNMPKISPISNIKEVDRSEANIEIEDKETVLGDVNNDSFIELMTSYGKKHSEGGIPVRVPEGSFIFSHTPTLKIDDPDFLKEVFNINKKKGGLTPADISRKFPLNKYIATIKDKKSTPIAVRSAAKMVENNLEKLGILAITQEAMKGFPDGMPEFTAGVLGLDKEAQEAVAKCGGLIKKKFGGSILPKFQDGKEYKFEGDVSKDVDPNSTIEREMLIRRIEPLYNRFVLELKGKSREELTRKDIELIRELQALLPKMDRPSATRNVIERIGKGLGKSILSPYYGTYDAIKNYGEENAKFTEDFHLNEWRNQITDYFEDLVKKKDRDVKLDDVREQKVALKRHMLELKELSKENTPEGLEADLKLKKLREFVKTSKPVDVSANIWNPKNPNIKYLDEQLEEKTGVKIADIISDQAQTDSNKLPLNSEATDFNAQQEKKLANELKNADLRKFILGEKSDFDASELRTTFLVDTLLNPKFKEPIDFSKNYYKKFGGEQKFKTGGQWKYDKSNVGQEWSLTTDKGVITLSDKSFRKAYSDAWNKQHTAGNTNKNNNNTQQTKNDPFDLSGKSKGDLAVVGTGDKLQVVRVKDPKTGTYDKVFETYIGTDITPGGNEASYIGGAKKLNRYFDVLKDANYDMSTIQSAEDMQKAIYNLALKQNPASIVNMWQKYGITNKGYAELQKDPELMKFFKQNNVKFTPSGTGYKIDLRNVNPNDEDAVLRKLGTSSYFDNKFGVRGLGINFSIDKLEPLVEEDNTPIDADVEEVDRFDETSAGPDVWELPDSINMLKELMHKSSYHPSTQRKYEFEPPGYALADPSRRIAASQEERNKMLDFLNNIAGGSQVGTAAALASSGDAFSDVANVLARTENANVGIVNNAMAKTADYLKARSIANEDARYTYNAEDAELQYNRENEKNDIRNRRAEAFNRGTENFWKRKAYEQVLFPNTQKDPITGDWSKRDSDRAWDDPFDTYQNPISGGANNSYTSEELVKQWNDLVSASSEKGAENIWKILHQNQNKHGERYRRDPTGNF